MTKQKNTKRALLASVLSMMLCMAMLVGSTFAWFTDSVTSGKNRIVAGNLDVELEYAKEFNDDGSVKTWESVQGVENIFNPDALWEPGHAEVVYLRLRNAGTLALKYNFAMNITKDPYFYNVESKLVKLSQFLQYGMVESQQAKFATREDAISAVKAPTALTAYSDAGKVLNQGEERCVALVVFMPTTVGNEANRDANKSKNAPTIELDFSVIATQVPHEEDSFGPNYDENAFAELWDGKTKTPFDEIKADAAGVYQLNSAADFAGMCGNASKFKDKEVSLNVDVNLSNNEWSAPTLNNVVFDGNGHTISGLNISTSGYAALFNTVRGTSVVKNLTVSGKATGENVGGIVGQLTEDAVIENCVSNVDIESTAKAGGIACMTGKSFTTIRDVQIRNCVNNGTINGNFSGVAGIVGYVNAGTTVTNCINNGKVTSSVAYVGGISGYVTGGNSEFIGCTNSGAVSGTANIGGIVGGFLSVNAAPSKVYDCVNNGALTGNAPLGSLVGLVNSGNYRVTVGYSVPTDVPGDYSVVDRDNNLVDYENIIGK